MALSVSSVWSSFDNASGMDIRDVSPILLAALNSKHDLISRIKVGAPVTNRKAEWIEQSLNPGKVTAGEAMDNSETTFTLASGHGSRVKVGDLLIPTEAGKTEVMQVTAISGDDLTVTRGYGSTSAETHSDAKDFRILPANQEGSSAGADRTRQRSSRYNYTQIFDIDVLLSDTALNTAWYNVPDEFLNSIQHRTIEIRDRMSDAVLNGIIGAAPGDSAYGTMGGIIEYVSANSNAKDTSTTTLTYDALSDVVGTIYDNGNTDGNFVVAVPRSQYEVIANWPDSQIRRQYGPNGQAYGGFVDKIVTKQGIYADVVLEPFMPASNLLVLDTNRVEINPMQNRAWKMYVSEVGEARNDYKAGRLVGEWTLRIWNPDTAHGLMTALT